MKHDPRPETLQKVAAERASYRRALEALTKGLPKLEWAGVARQSGWKRCGEQDGQFGGRGEEMIVAARQ
jgi:hypothetical protein